MHKLTIPFVLFFLLLAACGDSNSPTSSSWLLPSPESGSFSPAGNPITLSFISTDNEEPIHNVFVQVGENFYAAENDNKVTLFAPATNTPITITADGFFKREVVLSPTESSLTLDLLSKTTPSGLTLEITQALIYGFGPETNLFWNGKKMLKVDAPHVSVIPSEEIRNNRAARKGHQVAIDIINGVLEGKVEFSLESEESAFGIKVPISLNPEDPAFQEGQYSAVTRCLYTQSAVKECEIVFSSWYWLAGDMLNVQIILHELGHVLGLGHTLDPSDVMGSGPRVGIQHKPRQFSPKEQTLIKFLLRRLAGTEYEDRSPRRINALRATKSESSEFVCTFSH